VTERCRLYLITPPALDLDPFVGQLEEALSGGDVASLQLRLKNTRDEEIRRAADRLMPIVQKAGAAFILNDRPDLAKLVGCDGVHVGQEDMPYDEARTLVGPYAIIGVTCHASRHLAMEAADAGADYVAFGAFFPSRTKNATGGADLELVRWWAELMVVPCVAIGGIGIDNARPVVEAGADFIAVSSAVWGDPRGPRLAVKAFNALF
jgi:thiamine-phosphate pyrophosphorylase